MFFLVRQSYLKKHDVELAIYFLYSVIHSFFEARYLYIDLTLDDLQFIVVGQKLANCRPLENALKVSKEFEIFSTSRLDKTIIAGYYMKDIYMSVKSHCY